MNALKRWQQRTVLEAWHHALGSLFDQWRGDWPAVREQPPAVADGAPLLDISEDEKQYMITRPNCLKAGGRT